MKKNELAEMLAEALNILNGLQSELSIKEQGPIHSLFAKIPANVLKDCDFENNGSILAEELL